jgi:hypothetical protein
MVERLATIPPLFGIKTVAYADHVLPMENRQKVTDNGVERYVDTIRLYMQVSGRVRMLADGQEKWGWDVVETQEYPQMDPIVLRMGISIQGDPAADGYIRGIRYGTSKGKGGDNAWEKMETAARGRAIGAWGFGVLPGSGIATLEEMQDALTPGVTRDERREERSRDDIELSIHAEVEKLRQLRQADPDVIKQGIVEYVRTSLGIGMEWTEGEPLDFTRFKDGQLLLLERQVRQNIAAEERRQEAL